MSEKEVDVLDVSEEKEVRSENRLTAEEAPDSPSNVRHQMNK